MASFRRHSVTEEIDESMKSEENDYNSTLDPGWEKGLSLLLYAPSFTRTNLSYYFEGNEDELSIYTHNLFVEDGSCNIIRLHFEWNTSSGAEFRLWTNTGHGFGFTASLTANNTYQHDVITNSNCNDDTIGLVIYSNASRLMPDAKLKVELTANTHGRQFYISPHSSTIYTLSLSGTQSEIIKICRITRKLVTQWSHIQLKWKMETQLRFSIWAMIGDTWAFITVVTLDNTGLKNIFLNISSGGTTGIPSVKTFPWLASFSMNRLNFILSVINALNKND